MEKVLLVTGASKGFGHEIATQALARGYKVAATSRKASDLKTAFGDAVLALEVDVRDRAQVFAAVEETRATFGRIDVLVNNAGYGLFGPFESLSEAELYEQLRVNLFGPLFFCQAALPLMRAQKSGRILQLSSIAGLAGGGGGAAYHASKFALEGLSEALAFEAVRFGVKTTLVEPGAFRTDFAGGSVRFTQAQDPAWADFAAMVTSRMSALHEKQAGDPKEAVRAMLDAAEMQDPPLRLVLGEDAQGRARSKFAYVLAELDEFRGASRTEPFPGGAALKVAGFERPWRKS